MINKDYELIIDLLRKCRPHSSQNCTRNPSLCLWMSIVYQFAYRFSKNDVHFNESKFRDECGYGKAKLEERLPNE